MEQGSESPGGKPRAKARGPRVELSVGVPLFLAVLAAGGVASFRVPVRAPVRTPARALDDLIRKGPDSYFHHVFDPEKLLGLTGQLDLTLDNFERETSHGVLIAALPRLPAEAPDLTMHAAEIWQPGVAGADNGIIVFVFPEERHVRVEVGYGVEPALPDVEVLRLVDSTFVPPARAGDLSGGVEALVPPLLERLRTVPRAQPKRSGKLAEILVTAREIPRRVRMVWGAWLGGVRELRLIISAAVAFGAALLAVLLARIGHCALQLGRRFAARSGLRPIEDATLELTNSMLRLAQVAVIFFVMSVGTSFFFPGTGGFGGGGVDVRW